MRNNLKRIRELRGLEQTDVANDLDIPLSTYRSYEQGTRGLNGEKLIMFADYFGVSTDSILGTQYSELTEPEELTQAESELVAAYRSLNEEGKSIAISTVNALAKSGNYDE